MRKKTLIVGGGFYGMYLAEYLGRRGHQVVLCEREASLMSRASYNNQARVHNGYHYPRSVLTALRSRVSFPQFCREFSQCVDSQFRKYYLVGRIQSNVTARQFERFCQRIGAECIRDPGDLSRLVNPTLVESVFCVDEMAFDANMLRKTMQERLDESGVECKLGVSVDAVAALPDGGVEVLVGSGMEIEQCFFHQVFNCTYSALNRIGERSGIDIVPLRHELTELCLVDLPEPLVNVGVTVMCGPFFSFMPFPAEGLSSFSHVRYTPHYRWSEAPSENNGLEDVLSTYRRESSWKKMKLDAQRFIPCLSESLHRRSLWEVKTILPTSDLDDSRPIMFLPNHGIKGYHCVLGGKIDNVYDIIAAVKQAGLDQ